jgi:hypothetical protein
VRSKTAFFTEITPPQAMTILWNPKPAISRSRH